MISCPLLWYLKVAGQNEIPSRRLPLLTYIFFENTKTTATFLNWWENEFDIVVCCFTTVRIDQHRFWRGKWMFAKKKMLSNYCTTNFIKFPPWAPQLYVYPHIRTGQEPFFFYVLHTPTPSHNTHVKSIQTWTCKISPLRNSCLHVTNAR